MSDRLIREIGEALYGPRWQTDLSRDLNVSDRTMRRWASGADDVPHGVYVDLWHILLTRGQVIDELAGRARAMANDTIARQREI